MIRMIQSRHAAHAKSYFKQELERSSYYLDDSEILGRFGGRLATRLGLGEMVTKESFYALVDNRHPVTGGPLTQRNAANRTTGYDINFHCPKSVSILHALSKDDHILNAFVQSIRDSMKEIEMDCRTRVRTDRTNYHDRTTGELAWAEFVHQTSRGVEGELPDPHLHCHVYAFNATWDHTEKQFKAAQFRDIQQNMPRFEAAFHKRLADNLVKLGYRVRPTKNSFEIEGVPQKAIDLFSKRTNEIGQIAKKKGITNAKELDQLGARTRAKKQRGYTMSLLKQDWRRQILALDIDEREGTGAVRASLQPDPPQYTVKDAIDHSVLHSFERASVSPMRNLLREAYRYAMGRPEIHVDDITEGLPLDRRIIRIREGSRTVCTTREVLAEEKHMVHLATRGKGALRPLYTHVPPLKAVEQQADAIRHILTTPDRVSITRGAAGTGKTTMLKEAVGLIEETGLRVTAVAPSADASRVTLRHEGFKNAETVARLLVDKKMQEDLEGQVLLVDEAGLLGTKDMTALLQLATKKSARLLLVGDTRQHTAVVRGDALRILNKVAGIQPAEVSRIYRQKNKDYKEAIYALSQGEIKDAFSKLDQIGAIKIIDPLASENRLVTDYIATISKRKEALVIAPTHKAGDKLTQEIRAKLRESGKLGRAEITVPRLTSLNYTDAQKIDSRNYKRGHIIRFNQNMTGGIKRGAAWAVKSVDKEWVQIVDSKQKTMVLPLDQMSKFDVYERSEMDVSKGDKIRVTREGFDAKQNRLYNGQTLDVLSVKKDGTIKVRNTISKKHYTLPGNYGHIAHAHVVTSHASQGRTVDEVFVYNGSSTFAATNFKQLYVSLSRGRDKCHLYTDDGAELLTRVQELGDRQSAIETVANDSVVKTIDNIIRQNQPRQRNETVRDKPKEKATPAPEKSRQYEREPEI